MAVSRTQINSIKDFTLRTLLLGMYNQIGLHNNLTGSNWLETTNSPQEPSTAPPPPAILSVTGANGAFNFEITNAPQSANRIIYHELSYSSQSSFVGGSGVTTLPVSTATKGTVPAPGITAYWRIRSSYDQANWNAYQTLPGTIAAGLQSSAASEAATVLNQTNYANVDSVANGSSAIVRVFGKAGPNTQFPSVKGPQETILPSATVIGVPLSSQQVVGFDGSNYQVRQTLPEVLQDNSTPIGAVSVVGGGVPTLPTIDPIISGGAIIGYNVTGGGAGASAPYALTLGSTGGGTGATFGAQVIVGGVLISVAPGNPGSGYSGSTTVTASGGTFSGSTGGGQGIGGNGGRLITNDGTTG